MTEYCLGIDTSNYTTSAALSRSDGRHISLRTPFDVAAGQRGVRQSDAVFLHTKELPCILERIMKNAPAITAVAVSDKPRDAEGSYMPCFMAGLAVARSIAAAMHLPLYRLSHQRGHIMAALLGSGRLDLVGQPFHAFHVSGGTTELLRVEPDGNIILAGATADLNAGQLIDRCGVSLGLRFPCGPAMESLAAQGGRSLLPAKFKPGPRINLSGLENMFADRIKRAPPADCALWLLESIANALVAIADGVDGPLILAGGVMSNRLIKARLSARFETYETDGELAADNAVGVALWGAMQ